MAASDYVSKTLNFTLALKGASTDGKRTAHRLTNESRAAFATVAIIAFI